MIQVSLSALIGLLMVMSGAIYPVASQDIKDETSMVAPLSVSGLQSLSMSSASVAGTTPLTATITLTGPAPAGGVKVALKGTSRSESFVAGVVIPEGSSTGTFTVASTGVAKSTLVTLKATHNAISKEASYTRTP